MTQEHAKYDQEVIYGTTYDTYIYIYRKIYSKLVYVGLAQARPNYALSSQMSDPPESTMLGKRTIVERDGNGRLSTSCLPILAICDCKTSLLQIPGNIMLQAREESCS